MSTTTETQGGLSSFPDNSDLPAHSEFGSPMPITNSTEKYSNGYDQQVAGAPRFHSEGEQPLSEPTNGVEKRTSGCSCGGVHSVKPKKNWLQAAADWKIIAATLLAPTFLALVYYLLPPTKSDLSASEARGAAALSVATAGIAGQVKETEAKLNGKVDALSARVDGMQKTIDHTQAGVDELLRRSAPPPQTEVVSIQASTKAAAPASPPPTPARRAKKVEKKNDASLLGWIAR